MTTDGTPMPSACVGFIATPSLSLLNVYNILNFTLNLTSVSQLCDFGYLVFFILLIVMYKTYDLKS